MTNISAKTDIERSFFDQRAKKGLDRSPLQELEEGPRSGPHLLVSTKPVSLQKLQKRLHQ